jgi:hypothetical protein
VVYLPTTSYIEMNEWTLPAPRAHAYASLVKQERDHGRYERDKAFLRGGIWRNFLSRYSESNWMHKRMLHLSTRLDALAEAQRTPALQDLLYRAQANDAYWHGLFGGLYLPHLRRAVYNALVELEGALDRASPRPPREQRDADIDGVEEVFLHNDILQAVVRCDSDAALIELDSYSLRHNFGDTLRRREEHYYSKMHLGEQQHFQAEVIASAHDRVSFRHEISLEDLEPVVDPHVSQRMQVPLRTSVKCPHTGQGSPSYPFILATCTSLSRATTSPWAPFSRALAWAPWLRLVEVAIRSSGFTCTRSVRPR